MGEVATELKPSKTVEVVRGQYHKFMLIPIMPHHARFFDAGPVSFAVEARALGDSAGKVGERGASLHVFSADHKLEYARFDCFERIPHYHYIRNDLQHNIVWGYDPSVNGPMLQWALAAVRDRLPTILRAAGADELAERVEREGFDKSVLGQVEQAMNEAHEQTYPGTELALEGRDWMNRWKQIHPQFNTVDY